MLTDTMLDDWVSKHKREAEGLVPELVARLALRELGAAPTKHRFAVLDGGNQPGPDGETQSSRRAGRVPKGSAIWEIGTSRHTKAKASDDYAKATRQNSPALRKRSTLVIVSPGMSNSFTNDEKGQKSWVREKKRLGDWRSVEYIDGTELAAWTRAHPSIEAWFLSQMHHAPLAYRSPGDHWSRISQVGGKRLLPPVFLADRKDAAVRLEQALNGEAVELRFGVTEESSVADFVCAWIASKPTKKEAASIADQIAIISTREGLEHILTTPAKLSIIAGPGLDLSYGDNRSLVRAALAAGHRIISWSRLKQDPEAVLLPDPKSYEFSKQLRASGLGEEHVRQMLSRSGGRLESVLRQLDQAGRRDSWASSIDRVALATASLLGSWDENNAADLDRAKALVPNLDTWQEALRNAASILNVPLVCDEGIWRTSARFDAWHVLGPSVSASTLDKLCKVAEEVLGASDPQYDLPIEERFMASVNGKIPVHSRSLRAGLAETLALAGSFPSALSTIRQERVERSVAKVVTSLLTSTDWKRWASLNDHMCMLAEAAPEAFMECCEDSLLSSDGPLAELFGQESSGVFGGSPLTTGILWALESLSWSPKYLHRATTILARMAARDPGGNWSNRPANSLTTIFLPWFPQTAASPELRLSTLENLSTEHGEVGRKLVRSLLPSAHSASSGSHRPLWKPLIPADFPDHRTKAEVAKQYLSISLLAIKAHSPVHLAELASQYASFPPSARTALQKAFLSTEYTALDEDTRYPAWTALETLRVRHRRNATRDWAMSAKELQRLAAICDRIAPKAPDVRHRRLFDAGHHDLYEDVEDFRARDQRIASEREAAMAELLQTGGISAVTEFARRLKHEGRTGWPLGRCAPPKVDEILLTRNYLLSTDSVLRNLATDFCWGRLNRNGWTWVDQLLQRLQPDEKLQFLLALPSSKEVWERVELQLGAEASAYWALTRLDYYTEDGHLAADALLKVDRPNAALSLLYGMVHAKREPPLPSLLQALRSWPGENEPRGQLDGYHIEELIKHLQARPDASDADVIGIEWRFMEALARKDRFEPVRLNRAISQNPALLVDLISRVYRAKGQPAKATPSEQEKGNARLAYAYLHEWDSPPGISGETVDGTKLKDWTRTVLELAEKQGYHEIAQDYIGQVLTYVPAGQDLWLHPTAAAILDAPNHEVMRQGFRTRLFNRRGVFGFSGGTGERALADRYERQARELELKGFHRFARSLRDLASDYEAQGLRAATKGPLGGP